MGEVPNRPAHPVEPLPHTVVAPFDAHFIQKMDTPVPLDAVLWRVEFEGDGLDGAGEFVWRRVGADRAALVGADVQAVNGHRGDANVLGRGYARLTIERERERAGGVEPRDGGVRA